MADEREDRIRDDNDTNTAAPTGLDLHPKDTRAVKLKKSVGMAAGFGVGLVVLLIVWAIATRKGVGTPNGRQDATKEKSIRSAGAVGAAESDTLAKQANERRKAALGAAGQDLPETPGGAVAPRGGNTGATRGTGDVADNLDLPPTKVTPRAGVQYRDANGQPVQPQQVKSPRQLALEAAEREEAEARNAPMTGRAGGGSPSSSLSTPLSPATALADALRNGAFNQAAGAAGGGSTPPADDQNKQNEKETFLDRARSRPEEGYLKATRTPPISRFEVKAGWDIPATLEQAVNSDLPGEVRGLVKENVYDSSTGHYLLIPQGARVIGSYNHRIAYGQSGIQVVWTRLIYPDGSSIELGGMNGEDARGQSGFRDKVDNHYTRLVGFALLTSAFTAGIELSQNQQSNQFGYPSNSQVVTQALGQQLGELGISITNRNLNIQPTIKIPVGYRFNIRVNKDIAFAAPYRPS